MIVIRRDGLYLDTEAAKRIFAKLKHEVIEWLMVYAIFGTFVACVYFGNMAYQFLTTMF